MDLWSSPILSRNGFKYIATYTDDFTRYSTIYEMKFKSDQIKKFTLWKILVLKTVWDNLNFFTRAKVIRVC